MHVQVYSQLSLFCPYICPVIPLCVKETCVLQIVYVLYNCTHFSFTKITPFPLYPRSVSHVPRHGARDRSFWCARRQSMTEYRNHCD